MHPAAISGRFSQHEISPTTSHTFSSIDWKCTLFDEMDRTDEFFSPGLVAGGYFNARGHALAGHFAFFKEGLRPLAAPAPHPRNFASPGVGLS